MDKEFMKGLDTTQETETKGTQQQALEYLKTFHGIEPQFGTVEITCEGIADHMVMFHQHSKTEVERAAPDLLEALRENQLLISKLSNTHGGRAIGKSMLMKQFLNNEQAINKALKTD